MKLIARDAAQAEFEEARDYYLEHATPRIAAAFAGEYEQSVIRLLEYPLVGASKSR